MNSKAELSSMKAAVLIILIYSRQMIFRYLFAVRNKQRSMDKKFTFAITVGMVSLGFIDLVKR